MSALRLRLMRPFCILATMSAVALPELAWAQTEYTASPHTASVSTPFDVAPVRDCGQPSETASGFATVLRQTSLATVACTGDSMAAAQSVNRAGNVWISARLGALAGAAAGLGWGVKRTLADDEPPAAIAGYTAAGALIGVGLGALVGAVWPSSGHAPSRQSRVLMAPTVSRNHRGVRVTMSF